MRIQTVIACVLAGAVIAPVAFAQQAPKTGTAPKAGVAAPKATTPATGAAANQPQVNHGPPLTGVCVYSKENLAADTKMGKFVDQRLLQIQATVAAQVNQASSALNTATSNAQAQVDALPADQRNGPAVQTLSANIQKQAQDYVNLRNDLQERFDFTVEAALNRVYRQGQVYLQQVYEQHRCSLLLNTEGLIAFNPAMDITADVVKLVDNDPPEFEFDLVSSEALRTANSPGAAGASPGSAPPASGRGGTAAPARAPAGPPRAN